MEPLRTDDERKNAEYNYYLFYAISPTEKDSKRIEKKMNDKKNTFPQSAKSIDQKHKELFLEAFKIMTDMTLREEEFQDAKKIKLNEALKIISSLANMRGKIYKSDLKTIVDRDKTGWITLVELENGIEYLIKQGVQILDDTQEILKLKEKKDIEDYLKTLRKKDLYDFLGLTKDDSIETLQKKLIEIYNEALKNNNKTNEITAQQKLGGFKIFENEASKKNYDIYLATKDIWDEIKSLKDGYGLFEMQENELLKYAERIKTALSTTDIDFIELILAEGLKNLFIKTSGGLGEKPDLETCPYCDKPYVNDKNPKACPNCTEPLEIVCWNCGGKAPYTAKKKNCLSCGAEKDHSVRFNFVVEKIDNLLVQPGISITDIQTELGNLKNLWTDCNKVTTSKLAKKIAEYQEKVDKKVKEEETVGKAYKEEYEKIQELVNLKKYMSASGAVTALKNKYPTYNTEKTDALTKIISSKVEQAKQHADKAKTFVAQNNEEAAVSEVATALDLSADYEEAKQIVSKFPPRTPESASVAVKDDSALIMWVQNKPQKLVTYTVIRKNGSKPSSATDGTVVASELGVNSCEDKTIVSNTPYYYAVFASRFGANSPIICTTAPIVTYFDVSNIKQEIVTGTIVAKWGVPFNVSEVEVIRKKGPVPPSGREDGQKIPVKNNESFEDSDFDKAGNSYRFICVYKNDKEVIYSKGITRLFKAFEELVPLSNVKIEQIGTTSFTLSCDKIVSGKRGIYYSTQEVNCNFGKQLEMAEFRSFYKGVNEANLTDYDGNAETFTLPPDKTYYVYPIVCNDQLLIVSKPVIVNTMIGISQISVSEPNKENEIVIAGRLHQFAKTVIAKISNTAFPVTLNSEGDKLSVTKDNFVSSGGLHLKLKMNADSYITIFVETENEDIKSTTCGVKLSEPITSKERVTVRYKIDYNVSATKSFPVKIDFQADAPATIPELMLTMGNPKPLDKNAGQLVERTPVLTLKKGLFPGSKYTASITVKSPPAAVNTKFALFPSTDNRSVTFKEVRSL